MNGQAHTDIFRSAVAALDAPWRERLQALPSNLLERVANYPDVFDDPSRPEPDKERMDASWRDYCRLPDRLGGAEILHDWPVADPERHGVNVPLLAYYIEQGMEAVRSDDWERFCKFMGCLSHFYGDMTQSAHVVDTRLVEDLLPRPTCFASFDYHTGVERITGACGSLHPPQLMGCSPMAAAWFMAKRNADWIVEARAFVVPLIQALFREDDADARRQASRSVTLAAQGTLDAMHTVLSLAVGSIPEEVCRRFATVDLRCMRPDAQFQESTYGFHAQRDANRQVPPIDGPLIPGRLRRKDGSIETLPGLGVLPYSGISTTVNGGRRDCWLRFDLPVGVFRSFSCWVGMHPELAQNGAACFAVEGDGRVLFESGRLTGHDTACRVEVDVSCVHELTLRVTDANGGRSFWENHAYWGRPELHA